VQTTADHSVPGKREERERERERSELKVPR
jgi:hypothetical protein